MIRGHIALVRLLRAFMETSNLPWARVEFKNDKDDEGRAIYDPQRAEIAFRHRGKRVEVVIVAPSEERDHDPLPLGRLAARIDESEVIKGPIDQATWDLIAAAINREAAHA